MVPLTIGLGVIGLQGMEITVLVIVLGTLIGAVFSFMQDARAYLWTAGISGMTTAVFFAGIAVGDTTALAYMPLALLNAGIAGGIAFGIRRLRGRDSSNLAPTETTVAGSLAPASARSPTVDFAGTLPPEQVRLLKERLVRGDISPEEYQRIRSLASEQ